MADIELVIKLSEEDYESIKNDVKKFFSMPGHKVPVLYEAVNKGTPLPKGHGRIGDFDALEQEMINGIKAGNYEDGYDCYSHINNIDDCVECVRYADAIIEADTAEREDREDRE